MQLSFKYLQSMKGKKTGGRKKGTPNKATSISKQVIADLLTEYHQSGKMTEDFDKLEPRDRLQVAEKLIQYVMPKMQSSSVDITENSTTTTIENNLKELSKIPKT